MKETTPKKPMGMRIAGMAPEVPVKAGDAVGLRSVVSLGGGATRVVPVGLEIYLSVYERTEKTTNECPRCDGLRAGCGGVDREFRGLCEDGAEALSILDEVDTEMTALGPTGTGRVNLS